MFGGGGSPQLMGGKGEAAGMGERMYESGREMLAPAGPVGHVVVGGGLGETLSAARTMDALSPDVVELINSVRRFINARSLEEHR